ncbi:hypothetical protein WJD08_16200 [Salmonella enterica subsp. enterica serovar Corvallis]|uniref:hypothetical protein n=1 Tax=Enterobacter roggenkampii TaxID=1812935 RepID=UPI0007354BC9|nr:hypothetical protein [Enterobacter roggenkampii]EAT5342459.1 DNA-binding protein [Salmonella enterica]EBU6869059.1 hypothetical protein [Salmonella enterica subsp. enterica serovar Molade]EAV4978460.1 DNA-binding protein [Salmonella enterica]EBJ7932130.1 DNA-binding protein [Salmonella enterica]ECA0393727.1 DNA-binding protein [Salmonella enterica subsp. enterica serovar Molade]
MKIDLMTEEEVFSLLNKRKTAVWRLRMKCGFPAPILTHPTVYSRAAVEQWVADGGVNSKANQAIKYEEAQNV